MERLIGYDATPLEGIRSGVGHYTAHLLAHLVAQEDRWRYLLLANRPLNGQAKGSPALLQPSGPYFPVRSLWMQGLLPLVLRSAQPALCHFTNFIAPLLLPCPAVVTIHDMSLFLYPETQPRKSLLLVRSLLPLVARRAAAIITVSHSAARDIARVLGNQVSMEKVRVIYEAAAGRFRPVTAPAALERVRRRYRLERPFILYVGTIEPRKNLLRLVEAYALLKRRGLPHQLRLVGSWGWKYQALCQRIAGLGLEPDVVFNGYLPDEDLPALYTLADVVTFPSLYEGFGLPVIEAMACGTPVVCSNIPALAEIAGGAALLVDPYRSDELAEALAQVLTDRATAEALRSRGLARAAQFSWQQAAQETLQVYEEVYTRGSLAPSPFAALRAGPSPRSR